MSATAARRSSALTAYLDGELEGDRGSAIRGHLRGCEACRNVLRATRACSATVYAPLPTLDPPASCGRRPAPARRGEVADAKTPSWRRALARWRRWRRASGSAGVRSLAAIGVLAWRYNPSRRGSGGRARADRTSRTGTDPAAGMWSRQ